MDNTAIRTHLPCPSCGSSDALTLYSDGHTYCFSCQDTTHKTQQESTKTPLIMNVSASALPKRGLTQRTCERFMYYKSHYNGKPVQVATYFNIKGEPVGQKLRYPDKTFQTLGRVGDTFFGQQLYSHGERLIITEGEIDALTISQLYDGTECVVSIPNGVAGAQKVFKKNLEWLEGFNEIVVCFDNDDAGRDGVDSIKGLLSNSKLSIVTLSHFKDPNEYLINDKTLLLREAIENAKVYRPPNIVNGIELYDTLMNETEKVESYSMPWNIQANNMVEGIRKGELLLLTAGTGVGKSTFVREIMYDLAIRHKLKMGVLMLEENVRRTAQGILGIHLNKRVHISRNGISDEEYTKAFNETLGTERFFLHSHFGSLERNQLLSTIRYLAVAEKVDFIILDHISIAVSGIESDNERKMIDILMTKLRSICEETGVGMVIISHLRRGDTAKKTHEEGGIVSLSDLRGSQSLSQLSDTVIALERNQQDDDPISKNTMKVRVLKCRFTGETGLGGTLYFNKDINRLETYTEEKHEENILTF